MVERLREVKISVYIDTNKATYEESFDDIEEAKNYLHAMLQDLFSNYLDEE